MTTLSFNISIPISIVPPSPPLKLASYILYLLKFEQLGLVGVPAYGKGVETRRSLRPLATLIIP